MLFKMLGFSVGFCLVLIWLIIEDLSANQIVAHPVSRYAGAGPLVPIVIFLVLTGLGTILGIPDLKQSWGEYKIACQRHHIAKDDSANRIGKHF